MSGKNKLVPRLLGVTKESIIRVDERTKDVTFPFLNYSSIVETFFRLVFRSLAANTCQTMDSISKYLYIGKKNKTLWERTVFLVHRISVIMQRLITRYKHMKVNKFLNWSLVILISFWKKWEFGLRPQAKLLWSVCREKIASVRQVEMELLMKNQQWLKIWSHQESKFFLEIRVRENIKMNCIHFKGDYHTTKSPSNRFRASTKCLLTASNSWNVFKYVDKFFWR